MACLRQKLIDRLEIVDQNCRLIVCRDGEREPIAYLYIFRYQVKWKISKGKE